MPTPHRPIAGSAWVSRITIRRSGTRTSDRLEALSRWNGQRRNPQRDHACPDPQVRAECKDHPRHGCASGALFRTPGGEAYSYTGVDISAVAIEDGRRQSPNADLHVAALEDFQPAHSFDVIVFNEVLYYLDIDMAAAQVTRYAEHLDPGGTILVSMKSDPKSGAVFRALLVS